MTTLRMVVLTLLVMSAVALPVVTPAANASGVDAAEDFAYYLWQYYGW